MQLVNLNLAPILSARSLLNCNADDLPSLLKEIEEEQDLGNKFMKLFIILQNFQMDDFAQEMQNQAFLHRHVFRFLNPPTPRLRLLAIAGPGNMSQNAPLDFVLFNQNVQLDYYYVVDADTPFASVPEHDVAILALGESTQHNALHAHIEANRRKWPRPFLNHAPGVMRCARDRLFALLKDDHELKVPCTLRVERRDLKNELPPYLIRPIDTHAGDGFEKIPDLEALAFYLDRHFSDWFYVSEYIDCAMDDGLFRKFRIALIDKQPFICHYAISENWIVHYKSAHMELSLQKRKEEEKFMLEFEDVFLVKHGACLRRVAEKIDLDYVVLDCAESADGRLVLFEADNGAWIHDTDPQEIFPYKSKVMNRAFSAFTQMLLKAQSCGSDREARA